MGKSKQRKMLKGLKKYPYIAISIIGVIIFVGILFFRFGPFSHAGQTKTDVSSLLTDAVNISELSTAEFKYRGIAEIYSDEEKTNIQCRVCYDAVVKAGIDMKDIQFDRDDETMTVRPVLPDIDLKVVIIDENSVALLPSDADVALDVMLKSCKEDAENEARQSEELMTTARENLRDTIEGLCFPILKAQGYTIVWE